LADQDSVVAIGEVGLDFFSLPKDQDLTIIKSNQEKLFIEQIKLAAKKHLTLIIHARDQADQAYFRILELLKNFWPEEEPIIFHCASGPIAYLEAAQKIKQAYFGFDGNLTFKNAANIRDLFKNIQNWNPKRILLETDAPYLAPVPHRGKICQPWMIAETAKFAQTELNADLAQIYQNSLRAFKLEDYNL